MLSAVDSWRKDWESRDGDRYASHYSRQFNSDGLDYAGWTEQKRKVNAAKNWISVGTEKMTMFRYPGKDDMVVVTFQQDYKSNNLTNIMQKRQYWQKEDGQWKIIFEGAA
jgi:murein L,D-transpeptidase YafK